MGDAGLRPPDARARVGWWAFVLALGAAAAFVAYSFVGMIVLGVFGYYATRPIHRRLGTRIDSDGLAAWATVLLVLLPIVILLSYVGFQLFEQIQQLFDGTTALPFGEMLPAEQRETLTAAVESPREVLTDPRGTLETVLRTGLDAASVVAGALLLVGLAVTLSYFLLKNDDELAGGLRQLFGGRDTVAYAFATAVDEDLESIFFGNFLFVVAMTVIAGVVYWGTNLLAPEGMGLPMTFVLAFLTGVASLLPVIVGKVVYLPAVGYLALQAASVEGTPFAFVGGVLVVYFLVLDILPQTFLQPYITGRELDVVLMMFAYLLGPVLFGWYGFFLMPIVFVLLFETVRIVLPELLHGERLTRTASMGEEAGTSSSPADDGEPTEGDESAEGA